jgi:putative phage-type endonuclease
MTDSSIDRVYKYIENNVLKNIKNVDNIDDYIIENIYKNLIISCEYNISRDFIRNRLQKIKSYKKQLKEINKIPIIVQRSDEWFNTRKNLITASDMAQALNKGKFGNQKEFLIKKINSLLNNNNKYVQSDNIALVWGVKYEEVANMIYMRRNDIKVYEYGLIKHPTISCFGASPDGISELGVMLEIKCPFRRVINGTIPEQYWMQIQGQLEVCDLEECDYLECKISEYQSEKEFLDDTSEDNILTKDLNEKGIIFDYKENNETKYIYSKLDMTTEELLEWKRDTIVEFDISVDYNITYWRLDKYLCNRVYRDKEFFEDNIKKLQYLWDKIIYYLNNNNKYFNDIVSSKKKIIFDFKELNETILTNFAFVNDDENF